MRVLSGCEPERVFYYFEEICGIPHGSGNMQGISDYIVRFARDHHLSCLQDEMNNVIVFKGGTKGYEESEPIMLQGHIDMVCEKEEGCGIDFKKDGLSLVVEDGWISAKGTTLGGDDGIAAAYMLAILESASLPHPPLECIFTVDEEIGLLGAAGLDTSCLRSRTMLNLDNETEGHLLVSCAGGAAVDVDIPVAREDSMSAETVGCCRITVSGLLGGHSGIEIDKGRANAVMVLGRILQALLQKTDLRLISICGGGKDNAIPRSAEAVAVCDENSIYETIKEMEEILRKEYRITDPEISINCEKVPSRQPEDEDAGMMRAEENMSPMTQKSTSDVICALRILPNGIERMSFETPGLVQTSLNFGIIKTGQDGVRLTCSVRSNVDSEKEELISRIKAVCLLLGASADVNGKYPAWEYRRLSPLRDLMVDVYEKQTGQKPVVYAVHGGVECGIFAKKIPGLDCVSFGPDILDIHTCGERFRAESVERTWEYILEILRRLK